MTRTTITPTAYFAQAVKRYRTLRGWTQPDLAARCERAGLDWDRSIVANVESGRRASVSVHEVLVLAHVLGVAPAQLVLPLGEEESVEVVPGVEVHPLRALEWIEGVGQLPGSEVAAEDFARAAYPVQLIRRHREISDATRTARGLLRNAERFNEPGSPELARAAKAYRRELTRMVEHCRELSAAGVRWSGMAAIFYDDALDLGVKIPPVVTRYTGPVDGS